MRFTKYFICLTCLFTTITNESYSQDIPTSRRAEIAINETSPALKAAFKKHGLKWGAAVYIRIFKQENVLEIWAQQGRTFKLFKSYPICTFSGTLGPKTKEGDNQAPEGFYFVTPRQLNPHSQFPHRQRAHGPRQLRLHRMLRYGRPTDRGNLRPHPLSL